MKNKKSDIVWLAYYQRKIFLKFKEKERFASDIVLKLKVSKSTMSKIALRRLIDDYPRIRLVAVSSLFFKKN